MNYLEQIRGFWRSHDVEAFPPNAIALYFYLLEVNNKASWIPSFKRNNAKICADLGISFPTLNQLRNRLKQAEIIDFKTQNGNPNVAYSLKEFLKVDEKKGCEKKATSKKNFKVSDEVGNEVTDEVSNEVSSSKDKLKLKQKPKLKPFNSKSHSEARASDNKKKDLPFWKSFIGVWNEWYKTKFNGSYAYMDKDFAQLKKIYLFLKKRSDEKKFEFTEENFLAAFKFFLQKAWEKDDWLKTNFSIPNILSQFNQIVNGAANTKSAKAAGNSGEINVQRAFSAIDKLYPKT